MTSIPTNLARAYASTVTANGMFRSVSMIPMHDSFKSYSAITSAFGTEFKQTDSGIKNQKTVEKYSTLINSVAHFGTRLTEELALGFEEDKISEISSTDVTLKSLTQILQELNMHELQELSKIITVIKEDKESTEK